MINIDDFHKIEVRVGHILSAEPVPGSDKLLKLSVDFGDLPAGRQGRDTRTVVSGIAKHFTDPGELVGVKCAFCTNLEPRPLMGLTSEAMILAASHGESLTLLRANPETPPGAKIK